MDGGRRAMSLKKESCDRISFHEHPGTNVIRAVILIRHTKSLLPNHIRIFKLLMIQRK